MITALDLDTGDRQHYASTTALYQDYRVKVYTNSPTFQRKGQLSYNARIFAWSSVLGEPKRLPAVLRIWELIRSFEEEAGICIADMDKDDRKRLSDRTRWRIRYEATHGI